MAMAGLSCGILAWVLGLLTYVGFYQTDSVRGGAPGFVLGLPAVLFGHLAWHEIRTSGGAMRGKTISIAGLILGYLAIGCWIASVIGVSRKVDEARSRTNLRGLVNAIWAFDTEFGKLPELGTDDFKTDDVAGRKMLIVMLGKEDRMNPRGIPFLTVMIGQVRKDGGLVYKPDGSEEIEGLFDAWGNPYRVILKGEDEDVLRFELGARSMEVPGKRFVVISKGPDGVEGTADDLKSW